MSIFIMGPKASCRECRSSEPGGTYWPLAHRALAQSARHWECHPTWPCHSSTELTPILQLLQISPHFYLSRPSPRESGLLFWEARRPPHSPPTLLLFCSLQRLRIMHRRAFAPVSPGRNEKVHTHTPQKGH